MFVTKFKVQCKMTGRPSDVVTKIRPQTFYPYSVRRILRAHKRASARTSAKWLKLTINPRGFFNTVLALDVLKRSVKRKRGSLSGLF